MRTCVKVNWTGSANAIAEWRGTAHVVYGTDVIGNQQDVFDIDSKASYLQ